MKSKIDRRKEAIARMKGNIAEWGAWAKGKKASVDADRYSDMNTDFAFNGNLKTKQTFAESKINALNATIKNTEAKL